MRSAAACPSCDGPAWKAMTRKCSASTGAVRSATAAAMPTPVSSSNGGGGGGATARPDRAVTGASLQDAARGLGRLAGDLAREVRLRLRDLRDPLDIRALAALRGEVREG